jgi:MarR family transcriptional regulator for hemolysin
VASEKIRNFGFLLKAVSRLCVKRFAIYAGELDLSLPQCKVLANLARNEGISQARLAELTETDPMTLVRTLDRMEQDGWIERRSDPIDRRAHCLFLRDAAKPIIERIWKIAEQTCGEALAVLEPSEREHLIELLERVHAAMLAIEPNGERSKPIQRGATS